jgi:hydroxyacylglutathione hydrolase
LKEGYIKEAENIYVGKIEDNLDSIPKNKPIITVCGNGARASMGASILKNHGYQEVYNVLGSMRAWYSADYPIAK